MKPALKSGHTSLWSQMHNTPILWAIPLQALLLFSNLDLLDPWGDEWFTLTAAPKPMSEVIATVAGNIHPPLYYVLLHYWIQLPWVISPTASMRAMSAMWALVATTVILAYIGSGTALLYTHYLSGLAVAAGVCAVFLIRKRFLVAAGLSGLLAILYAPWVPALVSVLRRWNWIGIPYPYEGGNIISDQIVRLVYLFVSFSFGETLSPASLILSVALAPFIIYALWLGLQHRPDWFPIVFAAAAIAWLGVSRFEQFVFMPNHLLFVLPFFLILVVRHLSPLAFASLLVIYVSADYAYFTRNGFFVKPYAAPQKEMADVILHESRGITSLVAVSRHGTFSEPLSNHLHGSIRLVFLNDEASAGEVLEAASSSSLGPSAIWVWRRTRDISPKRFVTKLEQDLSVGREVRRREFLAYSLPERWARRLLRGPGQAEFYYQLSEFRTVNSEPALSAPP